MKKKLIYIGNNLAGKSNYQNMMNTLSNLLEESQFEVIRASDKKNRIVRLVHMIFMLFKHKKDAKFVLIDTFSTLNFYYAFVISQLARLIKLKYIPILHGGNLPNRLKNNPYLSDMIFANSYVNCSPSLYLKEVFEKEGFNIRFIPNFIHLQDYPFKERNKVSFKLLWVRAFEKTYNPLLVIKLLKELMKEDKNIEICMVGPEKDNSLTEFKTELEKNDLEKYVKLTGVLAPSKWHRLSEEYDIFINTTNADNMPVSIIEAMALGFPIVSTNAGGLPFLIDDGITGLLVSKNNAEEMANSIRLLVNDEKLVVKLSKNARNKAHQYDREKVKNEWLKLLN